tara:strand:- start:1236 stop:1877 length:642 start_codon:yes stop_codon:yes gene_type:complete
MASPTIVSGNFQLNYGAINRTETFSTVLDELVYSNNIKNFNFCDRRIIEASDQDLERGDIGLGGLGLLMIKNLNDYGDLQVDLNYVSSYVADLVMPPGAVNIVHSAQTLSQPVKFRCDLPEMTSIGVTSVATNGAIVFDSGVTDLCTAIMYRTGGGGSDADHYLVKISAANTGTVYNLSGNNTADLNTGSIYTSTTVVTLTPHVDYRTIATES